MLPVSFLPLDDGIEFAYRAFVLFEFVVECGYFLIFFPDQLLRHFYFIL